MSSRWTVDFEKYSALYISYLFDYLEEFSQIVSRRLSMPQNDHHTKIRHPGLKILRNWIEALLMQVNGKS